MLSRLFHGKKTPNPFQERIVWGIWAPRSLHLAYKGMAADLRVPISVLVGHILTQWLAQNADSLLNDEQQRLKYGDYLARKYLAPRQVEKS